MAENKVQSPLEVVKLRIDFLKHITTLSGAATLIVLTLLQRAASARTLAKMAEEATMMAWAAAFFGLAAMIALVSMMLLMNYVDKVDNVERFAGSLATDLAGGVFGTGVAIVMAVAFGIRTWPTMIGSIVLWVALLTLIVVIYRQVPERGSAGEETPRGTGEGEP